jgi:crotonobetainyl-CoA:carnitine CoA-transferase CaiB-like acyl-CoA transferase
MHAPFQGIKVIDLSAVVSGPMATGILADQGAQVIKVEAQGGDLTRLIGPAAGDLTPLFMAINRGKRCIVLDLKQAPGQAILRELVAQADVLVENFRPGALDRLGFSYDAVRAYNSRLVYLSISGFGHSGPFANHRVYDSVIQAASGFAAAHPDNDTGEPQLLQTLLCDKITALTAAQALSAALLARYRSGEGQKIELSMLDAAVSFLWPEALYNHAFIDSPRPAVPEFGVSQRLWRCHDGWFAMTTPQNDQFAAMCKVLGKTEMMDQAEFSTILARRDNAEALRALLDPIVAQRSVHELLAQLGAAGVPVGKVNSKVDLAADPQIQHNRTLVDTVYPTLGRVRTPRAAAVFPSVPSREPPLAGHLGEHTREVLTELGKSPQEIDALYASGVVR